MIAKVRNLFGLFYFHLNGHLDKYNIGFRSQDRSARGTEAMQDYLYG